MSDGLPKFRFAAPRDRRAWSARALIASAFAVALLAATHRSLDSGLPVAALLAGAGAAGFAVLAGSASRRVLARRPPLVIDESGLTVDDGLGNSWRVSWADVRGVALQRSLFRRRVVVEIDGAETPRAIPPVCHGDLPPEWLAGMIETLRERCVAPRGADGGR